MTCGFVLLINRSFFKASDPQILHADYQALITKLRVILCMVSYVNQRQRKNIHWFYHDIVLNNENKTPDWIIVFF